MFNNVEKGIAYKSVWEKTTFNSLTLIFFQVYILKINENSSSLF